MKRPAIIAIIAALLAGGFFVVRNMQSSKSNQGESQYKLTKAEMGPVKKTVSSSGVLKPWRIVDIKSRAGGEVQKMAVDVGAEVKAGQVIARIDPTDTLLSYNTARADLDSANARRSQSQKTYELQEQQTRISIASAEANLEAAKASLAAAEARYRTASTQAQAQPKLTNAAIANATAAYEQAVKQRKQLTATNAQTKASAQAAYDQAVANRDNAKLSVQRQQSLVAKGFVSQQAVDTAKAQLEVNEAQVMSAKARLDTVDAELLATTEAADARVAQSRAALNTAQANAMDIANRTNSAAESRAAVLQSRAQVLQSTRALEQARANAANNQIRNYDVAAARATIARSTAQMTNAKTILEQTTVRAPADGIILTKYVEEGTIIQSGQSGFSGGTSIVQLGDISKMYVEVAVDETDIANVDPGQKVDVNAEAYPGVTFEGKVVRVDPQALVEQNVTTVKVRVEIDNSSPTYRLLKPGMNCTCEFVVGERENVVTVPNEAVKEDDQGKYVEVATGGTPAPPDPKTGIPAEAGLLVGIVKKRVAVEVGLEGNEASEIVKGLKGDEQVVVQTIEPAAPTATASGSPFGGGNNQPRGFGRR